MIIYGVNHEATGKATYSNCVVYGLQYLNGVASIDSREYQGSADDYLPGHPQAQYLYAWKIARDSNGDLHCLEVPAGPQRYGISPDDKIILLVRAYLEKATKVGPAHNELCMDRVIRFSPKLIGSYIAIEKPGYVQLDSLGLTSSITLVNRPEYVPEYTGELRQVTCPMLWQLFIQLLFSRF